jgi:hypothetical protein
MEPGVDQVVDVEELMARAFQPGALPPPPLLASGDVSVARSVLAVAGTPMGGESAAERASLLLPFAASQRFSALRHLVGTSVD